MPITPAGLEKLKQELAALRLERPKTSKEIGVARDHGDLKENAEYHAAKEKQGMQEARMRELEDRISRAEVIDPSTLSGSRVKFGAKVTVEEVETGNSLTYRIVGADEASLSEGTISISAPLSRALINREIGDEVSVRAPAGTKSYEIIEIEW